MFTVAGWYQSGDAVNPYVGILKGDLQFEMSYDITVSKQKTAAINPQHFEFRSEEQRLNPSHRP